VRTGDIQMSLEPYRPPSDQEKGGERLPNNDRGADIFRRDEHYRPPRTDEDYRQPKPDLGDKPKEKVNI
jgi:hypothetical protein